MRLWLAILVAAVCLRPCTSSTDEQEDSIEEGRIAAGALPNSVVTLHPSLRPILDHYRGCYARIVSRNKKGLIWDNTEWELRSRRTVEDAVGSVQHLRLGAFCADGNSAAWSLMIRVSKPNVYTPRFEQEDYTFYVPRDSKKGAVAGRIRVWDEDPVIYNAKLQLELLGPPRDTFTLHQDGRLLLAAKLVHPVDVVARACDYGSPQRCASVRIQVVPVAVTPPQDIVVEAATERYQVISWRRPSFGHPESYSVSIDEKEGLRRSARTVVVKAEPDTDRQTAAVYFAAEKSAAYYVRVAANLGNESTPAEPMRLLEILRKIHCGSRCGPGGEPVCFWAGARSKQLYVGDEPQCLCHPGFTGHLCREKEECQGTIAYTSIGPTVWTSTRVNASAFAICPYGPAGTRLTRPCRIHAQTRKPAWGLVDMSHATHCVKKGTLLTKLALDSLVSLENFPLTADRLHDFAQKLEDVLFTSYADNQVARTIVGLIGEVMRQDLSFLPPKEEEALRTRFAALLHDYARSVVLEGRHERDGPDAGLITESSDITVGVFPVDGRVAQPVRELQPGLTLQLGEGLGFRQQRLSAIRLSGDAFYPTNSGRGTEEGVLEVAPAIPTSLLTLRGVEVRLERPPRLFSESLLRFTLSPTAAPPGANETGRNFSCVYYDPQEREWDTEGVRTLSGRPDRPVECASSHLTGFSIIFDFNSRYNLDVADRHRLNILSWIGCTLSTLGIAATILTYTLFRPLHKSRKRNMDGRMVIEDRAGQILLNLCLALGCLNVTFVASSLRPWAGYTRPACVSLGALLHYFTLATVLWMGVEAGNMYQMLVRVFTGQENCFLFKRGLVAWGIPFIVVGFVLSADAKAYSPKNDFYSPLAHYGASLVPSALVLLVNSVVFVLVLRALFGPAREAVRKNSTNANGKKSTMAIQVRGAVTVMALLGVTWVFGMLAVGPAKLVFIYVFAVLNSLQGLVIFVTRCLMHPVGRECWLRLLGVGGKGGLSSSATPSSASTTARSVAVKAEPRSPLVHLHHPAQINTHFSEAGGGESPLATRARVVTFREPRQPLLHATPPSPALTTGRSPLVRLRSTLGRRFPSLSLTSWKFVDDPPSPLKTAPAARINLADFEEE